MTKQEAIINQIYNLEMIEIKENQEQGIKTIFIQNAGFRMDDKFCFYCYDSNKKNTGMLYLGRMLLQRLIQTGTIY